MNKATIILIITVCTILVAGAGVFWIWVYRGNTSPHTTNTPSITTTPQPKPTIKESLASSNQSPSLRLTPRTLSFADGTQATFQLPHEFQVAVAAENLGKARFIAQSPDNRLFIPDMVDWNLSREGRIIILDNFNETTYTFQTQHTYLSNLRGPNSIAFYQDADGAHWIYIALTEHIIRYPYNPDDVTPSTEPEIIWTFPNQQSEEAKGIVWHITRTMLFHEDTLYVSVGSGCNACEQAEDALRAMILAMSPTGKNAEIYADGLRNAVGIEWAHDTLYATNNGADHLGVNAPDDALYKLEQGAHYGWPYCYESGGTVYEDTVREWEHNDIPCSEVPVSLASLNAHTAPLGLTYFSNAHPLLENTFLVALHGSYDLTVGNGYNIVRVTPQGEQEVFMGGFLNEQGDRFGRPVHILQATENSFFVTDDFHGRLLYIYTN